MLDRFLHPPNKCSKVLVAISQKFYCREEAWAMQKLFIKKKKNVEKKIDKCPRYWKQWVLRCPPKKEMNKIAHVLLQSCFQVSKERYVFKEHSRNRLATIYIHHIHPHTCTFWFDCMTTLFGSEVWLYNICIASMFFYAFFTPMSST